MKILISAVIFINCCFASEYCKYSNDELKMFKKLIDIHRENSDRKNSLLEDNYYLLERPLPKYIEKGLEKINRKMIDKNSEDSIKNPINNVNRKKKVRKKARKSENKVKIRDKKNNRKAMLVSFKNRYDQVAQENIDVVIGALDDAICMVSDMLDMLKEKKWQFIAGVDQNPFIAHAKNFDNVRLQQLNFDVFDNYYRSCFLMPLQLLKKDFIKLSSVKDAGEHGTCLYYNAQSVVSVYTMEFISQREIEVSRKEEMAFCYDMPLSLSKEKKNKKKYLEESGFFRELIELKNDKKNSIYQKEWDDYIKKKQENSILNPDTYSAENGGTYLENGLTYNTILEYINNKTRSVNEEDLEIYKTQRELIHKKAISAAELIVDILSPFMIGSKQQDNFKILTPYKEFPFTPFIEQMNYIAETCLLIKKTRNRYLGGFLKIPQRYKNYRKIHEELSGAYNPESNIEKMHIFFDMLFAGKKVAPEKNNLDVNAAVSKKPINKRCNKKPSNKKTKHKIQKNSKRKLDKVLVDEAFSERQEVAVEGLEPEQISLTVVQGNSESIEKPTELEKPEEDSIEDIDPVFADPLFDENDYWKMIHEKYQMFKKKNQEIIEKYAEPLTEVRNRKYSLFSESLKHLVPNEKEHSQHIQSLKTYLRDNLYTNNKTFTWKNFAENMRIFKFRIIPKGTGSMHFVFGPDGKKKFVIHKFKHENEPIPFGYKKFLKSGFANVFGLTESVIYNQ